MATLSSVKTWKRERLLMTQVGWGDVQAGRGGATWLVPVANDRT